jgi:rubrerythrin
MARVPPFYPFAASDPIVDAMELAGIDADAARARLVVLLGRAFSGELAAATAYAGHWRSVRRGAQRDAIRAIEDDERKHRARVGEMLAELGGRPSRLREIRMYLTGFFIAILCFIGGWYVPMYGAGRIERTNIREYEDAARLAFLAGLTDWADELLHMAEVEWDHEKFFHDLVRGHFLHRLGSWREPPPRAHIRSSFDDDLGLVR